MRAIRHYIWCLFAACFLVLSAIQADAREMPLAYDISTLGVDCATIQDWITAKNGDFVAAQKGQVLVIPEGVYTLTGELPNNNTSADYFWVIMAADGATVTLAPTSLAHVINYGNYYFSSFQIWGKYSVIKNINIDWAGANTLYYSWTSWQAVPFLCHSTASNTSFIGCTVKNLNIESQLYGIGFGFFTAGTADGNAGNLLINCGVRDSQTGIEFDDWGSSGLLYNCTFRDVTTGVRTLRGTIVAKNCLADNSAWDAQGIGSFVKTTCLDATPTWASGSDFDLDPADTTALGMGTSLSADGVFAFNDDIHGDTRPAAWSVGADDYNLSGSEPEPDPEVSERTGPWSAGPWGAGPWTGGGNMGKWN